MNWQAISFDWNQIRAFLATVEEGSFSAAARAINSTQPTLSRQITALEIALGVTLFQRGKRSMALTSAGTELLEHVRDMAEAATKVSLIASGQSLAAEGLVTVTATSFTASRYLPSVLERLQTEAPGIEVEIIVSNEVRDLNKREADIALRHARPEQPDLIAKLIDEAPAYLYASENWLEEYGTPSTFEDLTALPFIGFQRPEFVETAMRERGLPIGRQQVHYWCDNGEVMLELVRKGLGICILPSRIAEEHEDLVPILADHFSINIPTWLVTHGELHTSHRVRVVFDMIADVVTKNKKGGP